MRKSIFTLLLFVGLALACGESNSVEEQSVSKRNNHLSRDFVSYLSDTKTKLKQLEAHLKKNKPYNDTLTSFFNLPGNSFISGVKEPSVEGVEDRINVYSYEFQHDFLFKHFRYIDENENVVNEYSPNSIPKNYDGYIVNSSEYLHYIEHAIMRCDLMINLHRHFFKH